MARDDEEWPDPDGSRTWHTKPSRLQSSGLFIRKTKLIVKKGPDAGREFVIEPDFAKITIGSRKGNDLELTDEEVSRHHAEIVPCGGSFLVRDLQSTNGTFVDGLRIKESFLMPNSPF